MAIVWKMGNYSSLAVKNWGKKFQVIDWVITASFSGTLLSPSPRVRERETEMQGTWTHGWVDR